MRLLMTIVMVLGLGLAACGKKGDLLPPGGEPEDEAQTSLAGER